jgi:transaldolase
MAIQINNVKIFADGADYETMLDLNNNPLIKGLTTNPSLLRKAGVLDYEDFFLRILKEVNIKPLSIEVFSDDLKIMEKQALYINSWGKNIYVKIPVTNSEGISTLPVIESLSGKGVRVNVTAVMTNKQVEMVNMALDPNIPSYISIFAGRIADTGRDPVQIITNSLDIVKNNKECEIIWASPREFLNIIQADQIGCHIITATKEILNKLSLLNLDLNQYSLETVRMFHEDARVAGYQLKTENF